MNAAFLRRIFSDIAAHPFLTLIALLLIPAIIQHASVLRDSVNYPGVCEKDYIQDYAMMAALHAGESPYAPIPELVARFVPDCRHVPINIHPSPHPISMTALTSPLAGVLSYPESYALWAILETLALLAALLLMIYIPDKKPAAAAIVLAFIVGLGGFSTFDDIFLGQVNFTILALLAAGMLALRKNEPMSGLLFGLAIGIKFFGWPIAVLLLLKKRWKACAGILVGFLVMQAMAVAVAGLPNVLRYYQEVTPRLSSYYAACGLNQSLLTLPRHLFQGYSEHCFNWPDDGALALPFFASDTLFQASSLFLPLFISGAIFFFACKARPIDDALSAVICFSVIASPVVWGHAGVLTYIALTSLYSYWPLLRRSLPALLLLMLWITAIFIIPTFVPGSPNQDLLAALHNVTVLLASLSSAGLVLYLARLKQ